MKKNAVYTKIISVFTIFLLGMSGYSQTLPFGVYLEPLTVTGLSGVQSFAFGQDNGHWLIVGGRLDGLHKAMGMGMSGTPFPYSSNNKDFIVVNPNTAQKWTAPLSSLSTDLQEQLSSTNTQYFQEGDYLYILGGYGYQSAEGKHKTFDKLTAIDVPQVINAVKTGSPFATFIRQITDIEFQVTGGQLEKIYDTYYLVGGQNFDGTYHHMGGMGMFTQTYTNQIKPFLLHDDGSMIHITHLPAITDNVNLHRRDYNMVQQIMPNGKEGLTAFSGVFQTTADIPYLNCVNIDSTGYVVNNAFSQYYNHYQCANFPFYTATNNEMFTVFFGGIAQYYDNAGVLTQDNNVPFVKTIACVKRDAMGLMTEYKLSVEMPALLGAGSEFFPIENLDYYQNHVLKLDALSNDTTLVGYIVGGISSPSPNVFSTMMGGNSSTASNQIFKVFLVKNNISGILNPQSNNLLQLQMYPNPSNKEIHLNFHLKKIEKVKISVVAMNSKIILNDEVTDTVEGLNTYQLKLDSATKGVFIVNVTIGNDVFTQKIVRY